MSKGALQLGHAQSPHVEVLDGPLKGKSFPLIGAFGSEVTLGRSSENDIVLKHDSKCSRHHAILRSTPQGWMVESLNPQNPVQVNSAPVGQAVLLPGVTLQLGETSLLFVAPIPEPPKEIALHQAAGPAAIPQQGVNAPAQFQPEFEPAFQPKKSSKKRKPQQQSSPMFMFVIFGLIVLVVFILLPSGKKSGEEVTITRTQDIEAEIEASRQMKEAKEKQLRLKNKTTVQYREAQSAYIKGFRDYEKGLYGRARDSFMTCLSLDPGHTLCKRYLGLSNRKFNEIVQYYMILGKDHRDRNQFQACKSSMRTVMVMVKDKTSQIYKQAKAHFEACSSQLGDGY